MQDIFHPNVVTLKHAFITKVDEGKEPGKTYLNLVMDYMPETVYRVHFHYCKMK